MEQSAHDNDDSVPISALEHYAYCPRQAALIHSERYFESNLDTVRGDLAHAAVDRPGAGADRRRHQVWRSLPIWSTTLGLHGICDVVQFGPDGPTPVEHKSGRYLPGGPADLQAGAQALCLREMFDAPVPIAVVFSGRDRQRHEVVVDGTLADRVKAATTAVRALRLQAELPPAVYDRKCTRCSLRPGCLPELAGRALDLYLPRPRGDWND